MMKTILAQLKSRRLAESARAEREYLQALDNAEFLALERKLKELYKQMGAGEDVGRAVKELEERRARLLAELNLNITAKVLCAECGDTGYCNSELCRCVKSRLIKRAGLCGGDNDGQAPGGGAAVDFGSCSTEVFSGAQRKIMQSIYNSMDEFCNKFPRTEIITMTFSGGTGTGKTFLVNNLSAVLSAKGQNVLYYTAFGINQLFLKTHLAPIEQKGEVLGALVDADMVIIDDLGTENILKNVTLEYLTNIITERMALGRHTVITTNLAQEEILARYGERVFSRINNKKDAVFIVIGGQDLRLGGGVTPA